jgi:hypothetical protein
MEILAYIISWPGCSRISSLVIKPCRATMFLAGRDGIPTVFL